MRKTYRYPIKECLFIFTSIMFFISSCIKDTINIRSTKDNNIDPKIIKAKQYSEKYGNSFSFISIKEITKSADQISLTPDWNLATVIEPGNDYINIEVPFYETTINKATIINSVQNTVKDVKVSSRLVVSQKGDHIHQFIITKLWLNTFANREPQFNDININTLTFIYDIHGKLVNQYETRNGKMYSFAIQNDNVTNKDQIKYNITLGEENFAVSAASNSQTTKAMLPIYGNCSRCGLTTYNYVCAGCTNFDHGNGNYSMFFHNITEYIKKASDDIMGSMILCTYGYCNESIRLDVIRKSIQMSARISNSGLTTFEDLSQNYTRWDGSDYSSDDLLFSEGYWTEKNNVRIFKSSFMDFSDEIFFYRTFDANLTMNFYSVFGCSCDETDPDNPNQKPDKIPREICERCHGCINHYEHDPEIYCPKRCSGNCCNHVERCVYCKLCIHKADDPYDDGCDNPCPSPDLHYKMVNLPIHAPKTFRFVNIESDLSYNEWLAIEAAITNSHINTVILNTILELNSAENIKIEVEYIEGGFYGKYLNGKITISDTESNHLESTLGEELFHRLQHIFYGFSHGPYYEIELEAEAFFGFIDYQNGCMIGAMASDKIFRDWFDNIINYGSVDMGDYYYEALLSAFIAYKGSTDILTRSNNDCFTTFDVFRILNERL